MIIQPYEAAILHAKAYRILRNDVALMLKPFHLTLPEWSLLSLLEKNPSMRSTQLAHELGVETPMVTNLLNILEEKGFLSRAVSDNDKRSRNLVLTAQGAGTMRQLSEHLVTQLLAYFDDVSEEEISGHIAVLKKIIAKHSAA